MRTSKLQLVVSSAALVAALALAADRLVGIPPSASPPLRGRVLLVGLVLATGLLAYSRNRELQIIRGRSNRRLNAARRRVMQSKERWASLENRCRQFEAQVRRLHTILHGLSDPLLAIGRHGELILVNRSAEELFGVPRDHAPLRSWANLVRCEPLVELLAETRRRNGPSLRSQEIAIRSDVGPVRWFRVTARAIPAESGGTDPASGMSGVVAVLHDISLQRSSQQHTAEVVSVISHEMKTPLAAIKAYVELLFDDETEDERARKEFLEVIGSQANRLERLIDHMLSLARLEAGVARVDKQNCSLNELLAEAVERVGPAAERETVALRSELSATDSALLVDRNLVLEAAVQLLANAVKSAPRGGHVTLRTGASGDAVRIDVEDNGATLTSEDCERAFDKFYRAPHHNGASGGTGLGLPLVKHIVEYVHNGSIEVQSAPGKGSVFSIYLPSTARADDDAAALETNAIA